MDSDALNQFIALSREAGRPAPTNAAPLKPHASARQIYRLTYPDGATLVGVINPSVEENRAFVGFTEALYGAGFPTPAIVAYDGALAYLETDLGDETLFDRLQARRSSESVPADVEALYGDSIDWLAELQSRGLSLLDSALFYQGARFDAAAMRADYAFFAAEYAARLGFRPLADEAREDFERIVNVCAACDSDYFLYRDFQARNIMIVDEKPFFIDYQSGRAGPPHYDLASLLFQAQAALPPPLRESLLTRYLGALSARRPIDESAFRREFILFALLRTIQTLGAYGKLGLGDGKEYFRRAIPFAKANVAYILDNFPETGGGAVRRLMQEIVAR